MIINYYTFLKSLISVNKHSDFAFIAPTTSEVVNKSLYLVPTKSCSCSSKAFAFCLFKLYYL